MVSKKIKDKNSVALPTMSCSWNEIKTNNIKKLKDNILYPHILMVLVYMFFGCSGQTEQHLHILCTNVF